MMVSNRNLLFQGLIFRFYVKLRGSTRTYSLASSLQPSGIRIDNHVFSNAGGAQWKRKGLRAAIISNTHRITWIYIWIISVLCKMNHKKPYKAQHTSYKNPCILIPFKTQPICIMFFIQKNQGFNHKLLKRTLPISPMSWTLKPRFVAPVPGTNVNPLGTLLQNFEAALYTVKRFYEHLNACWTSIHGTEKTITYIWLILW